ncbi:11_t:CDS:2, partial [Dentiscutata erythropus]
GEEEEREIADSEIVDVKIVKAEIAVMKGIKEEREKRDGKKITTIKSSQSTLRMSKGKEKAVEYEENKVWM